MDSNAVVTSSGIPTPTPPQIQSIAALLPAEIVGCNFSHFDLNYSLDAYADDRAERIRTLSNLSVVAEGWNWPARRLLFRTVRIRGLEHIMEHLEERAGLEIRSLLLNLSQPNWSTLTRQETVGPIFKLLKKTPNLRQLRLSDLPFTSFNPADSTTMQDTLLLPHLSDLTIIGSRNPFPQSVVSGLLKTSGHRISRFKVSGYQLDTIAPSEEHQLDFGGKLRYLEIESSSSQMLLQPPRMDLKTLEGLQELHLNDCAYDAADRTPKFFEIIAPTLDKLTISDKYPASVARCLPRRTHLSRLHLYALPSESALFYHLPPSLSFLRLRHDGHLLNILTRWNVEPSLVPATLNHILIDDIDNGDALRLLPSLNKLGTNWHGLTAEFLAQLRPGTTPSKVLEMYFSRDNEERIPGIEAECKRLGVKFCRRTQAWDH